MGKHRKNPDRKPTAAQVGYGKPPKSGQFKPGKTGNPKGRPRRRNTISQDRDLVLHELITVEINGKPRKITRQNAIIRTMSALAIKGDVRAARFMFDLERRYLVEDPSVTAPDNGISAEDHALLADYVRRTEAELSHAANDDFDRDRPEGGGGSPPEDEGKGRLG